MTISFKGAHVPKVAIVPASMPHLKGFRVPREIIAYTVWIYHRFIMSTADDKDLLAERSVKHWFWRAIDADGNVLDILVQPKRSARAAKQFLNRLIVQYGQPRVVITDKLCS